MMKIKPEVKLCNGKVSYENQGLALVSGDESNKYRIKEGNYTLIFMAYECDACLHWHLTSLND